MIYTGTMIRELSEKSNNLYKCKKHSETIRSAMEAKVMEIAQEIMPKEQRPLRILSISEGRYLQELILTAKLNEAGYAVQWSLVTTDDSLDKRRYSEQFATAIHEFNMVSTVPGNTISQNAGESTSGAPSTVCRNSYNAFDDVNEVILDDEHEGFDVILMLGAVEDSDLYSDASLLCLVMNRGIW